MSLPESDDQHLWISWDDYHRKIEQLALLLHESDWQFDQILCLARGGLRPGDVLARIFNVPLAILATSSYRANAGTEQGLLDIAAHITITSGSLGGRVLLVDDLIDTGVTIQQVVLHLEQHFPAVEQVKVAALWQKAWSPINADFVVERLQSNPWIHQPFEIYDTMRPAQLLLRRRDADS